MVKNKTLQDILREQYERIMVLDEYGLKVLKNQIDVFIDIGCTFGPASKMALQCGCKKVYAFEPNEVLCDLFMENVAHHYPDKVKLFRQKTVTRKFGDTKHSIEDIIRQEMNKKIFLRINANGDEYAILSELDSSGLLRVPRWIMGEYHTTQNLGFNIALATKAADFIKSLKRRFKTKTIIHPDKKNPETNLLGLFLAF
jgi:hypothetical protein